MVERKTQETTGPLGREVTARRKPQASSSRFVRNVKIPRWLFDKADGILEEIAPSQGKTEGPKATLPKDEHLQLAQEMVVDLSETCYPAVVLSSIVCELYRSGKGVDALDPQGKKTINDVVGGLAENVESACRRAQHAAHLFIPQRGQDDVGKVRWVRNPFVQELQREVSKANFMMNNIAQVCGVVLRPDPATGRILVTRRKRADLKS